MIAGGIRVVNAGLPLIVEGVPPEDVVQLDWRPPAFGDADVARAAVGLDDDVTREANRRAIADFDCRSTWNSRCTSRQHSHGSHDELPGDARRRWRARESASGDHVRRCKRDDRLRRYRHTRKRCDRGGLAGVRAQHGGAEVKDGCGHRRSSTQPSRRRGSRRWWDRSC